MKASFHRQIIYGTLDEFQPVCSWLLLPNGLSFAVNIISIDDRDASNNSRQPGLACRTVLHGGFGELSFAHCTNIMDLIR